MQKFNQIVPAGIATLSKKGQIVIPKQVREVLGVRPKDEVLMIAYQGEVRLMKKPRDWVTYAWGLGKEVWEKLGGADAYIKKERASWTE